MADVITGMITTDQHARREDDWKGRMDPMGSFLFVGPYHAAGGGGDVGRIAHDYNDANGGIVTNQQ